MIVCVFIRILIDFSSSSMMLSARIKNHISNVFHSEVRPLEFCFLTGGRLLFLLVLIQSAPCASAAKHREGCSGSTKKYVFTQDRVWVHVEIVTGNNVFLPKSLVMHVVS